MTQVSRVGGGYVLRCDYQSHQYTKRMPKKSKRACFRRVKNRKSKVPTSKGGDAVGFVGGLPDSTEPIQSIELSGNDEARCNNRNHVYGFEGASKAPVKVELHSEADFISDRNISQFSVFSMEIAMEDEGDLAGPADVVQSSKKLPKSVEVAATLPSDVVEVPLFEFIEEGIPSPGIAQSSENVVLNDEEDSPPSADVVQSTQDLFRSVLPPYWTLLADKDGYNCLQHSRGRDPAMQRNVYVTHGGTLRITVHRRELPEDIVKEVTKDWPSGLRLTSQSSSYFVDQVLRVVMAVRAYEVCVGARSTKFEKMWASEKNGYIDCNPYGEARYTKTFRSSECSLLVPTPRLYCSACSKAQHRFEGRMKRHSDGVARSNTGHHYLTEAQKELRLASQSKIIANLKNQLRRAGVTKEFIEKEES